MQTTHSDPRFSVPLIDDVGFVVDVWAEREVAPGEGTALAAAAEALSGTVLTRDPYLARGLATVDDDVLWVSVEVVGEGRYDDSVSDFARGWFDVLWDAVQRGADVEAAGAE